MSERRAVVVTVVVGVPYKKKHGDPWLDPVDVHLDSLVHLKKAEKKLAEHVETLTRKSSTLSKLESTRKDIARVQKDIKRVDRGDGGVFIKDDRIRTFSYLDDEITGIEVFKAEDAVILEKRLMDKIEKAKDAFRSVVGEEPRVYFMAADDWVDDIVEDENE